MIYKKLFEEKFQKIIESYKLEIIELSDETLLLKSKECIFMITIHFDDMYVEYIHRNERGKLIGYNISSYIASKFDSDDRKDIIPPQNVLETITAIFTIWCRGLPRHFNEMLQGDKAWIEDYKVFELAGESKKIPIELEKIIDKYI